MSQNILSTVSLLAASVLVVLGSQTEDVNLANVLGDCLPSLPRTEFVKPYHDVCLEFVDEEVTWADAKTACRDRGGDLVIIRDQDKQEFVVNTLKAFKFYHHRAWIGATDRDQEGVWKWVDGSKVVYGNWHPGEGPSHGFLFVRGIEDCALIDINDDGRWHDYRCGVAVDVIGLLNHLYICEYQRIRGPTTSSTMKPETDAPTAKLRSTTTTLPPTITTLPPKTTTIPPTTTTLPPTTTTLPPTTTTLPPTTTTLPPTTTTLPPTTTTLPPTTTTLPPTTTTLPPTTTTLPPTTTTLPSTTTTLPPTTTTLPPTTTTLPPTTTTLPPTTTTLPPTTTTLPSTTTTLPPTTTTTLPPTTTTLPSTTTTLPPTTTTRPTTTTTLPTTTTPVKTTTMSTAKPTTTFGGIKIEFGTTPHAKKRKAEPRGKAAAFVGEHDDSGDGSSGDIMTGATYGAGDAHSSGTPDLAFGFYEVTYIAIGAGAGVLIVLVASMIAIAIRRKRRLSVNTSVWTTDSRENPIYDIMNGKRVASD